MAEKLTLGLDVDKELIEFNVTNAVAGAIALALGDKETLVNDAIKRILGTYVKKGSGERCKKGEWNSTTYLQYVAEKCVTEAVQAEMTKAIEEHKDAFVDALKKELSKPSVRSNIAANFVSTMLAASKNNWKMPVSVSFELPKDD